jgi:hypothetical protein
MFRHLLDGEGGGRGAAGKSGWFVGGWEVLCIAWQHKWLSYPYKCADSDEGMCTQHVQAVARGEA